MKLSILKLWNYEIALWLHKPAPSLLSGIFLEVVNRVNVCVSIKMHVIIKILLFTAQRFTSVISIVSTIIEQGGGNNGASSKRQQVHISAGISLVISEVTT